MRSGPATQLLSASFLNSSSMTKNDIVLTKCKWNHISENCFEFQSNARDGNGGGSNWTRTSTIEIAEFIFNSPSNLETRICQFKKNYHWISIQTSETRLRVSTEYSTIQYPVSMHANEQSLFLPPSRYLKDLI